MESSGIGNSSGPQRGDKATNATTKGYKMGDISVADMTTLRNS